MNYQTPLWEIGSCTLWFSNQLLPLRIFLGKLAILGKLLTTQTSSSAQTEDVPPLQGRLGLCQVRWTYVKNVQTCFLPFNRINIRLLCFVFFIHTYSPTNYMIRRIFYYKEEGYSVVVFLLDVNVLQKIPMNCHSWNRIDDSYNRRIIPMAFHKATVLFGFIIR